MRIRSAAAVIGLVASSLLSTATPSTALPLEQCGAKRDQYVGRTYSGTLTRKYLLPETTEKFTVHVKIVRSRHGDYEAHTQVTGVSAIVTYFLLDTSKTPRRPETQVQDLAVKGEVVRDEQGELHQEYGRASYSKLYGTPMCVGSDPTPKQIRYTVDISKKLLWSGVLTRQ
ncbi:hypothetical protein ACSNOK_19815 [Streptomyces sp. URMC 126]|uniref:hypothetical protein n=1 Tax=Streptomyces sp. URMC 126 TaxID=3423401 RepID=UPI003F1BDA7E